MLSGLGRFEEANAGQQIGSYATCRGATPHEMEILDIPSNRIGAKLVDLYRKDLTKAEEFERFELLKLSKDYYRKKGAGRPTKKDRRDLNEFSEE